MTSVTLVVVVVRLLALWSLAACSFEHGIPGVSGGGNYPDATEGPIDAAVVLIDAKLVDAKPVDAPCADDDSDGICNAVDDWPCGVKPAAPSATMTMTGNNGQTNIQITAVNLDGTGRLAVALSQDNLSLELDYDITDKACPQACVDQIEIGWVPGTRLGCPFDGQVSKQNGESGSASVTVKAPTAKGTYDLRANIGQNFSCNSMGANSWWGATPAASRTIAKLCVH